MSSLMTFKQSFTM